MPPKRSTDSNQNTKKKPKPNASSRQNPNQNPIQKSNQKPKINNNPKPKNTKSNQTNSSINQDDEISMLQSLVVNLNKQLDSQNQYFSQIQKENEIIRQRLQSLRQKVKQYIGSKPNKIENNEKDKEIDGKNTTNNSPKYHGYTNRKDLINEIEIAYDINKEDINTNNFYTTKSPPFNNHRYTNPKI